MTPDRNTDQLVDRELTGTIIGAFFDVYNELGFGFLESIYGRALQHVLSGKGITVAREFGVPVHFRGERIGLHRLDMLVEGRVIVEIKATDVLPATARRQLRNYLCATNLDVGLILHFGPKAEFQRMIGQR